MSLFLTINSMAWMSKDVYCDNETNLFNRLYRKGSPNKGFFGAAYKDFTTVILAVRGTAESQDAKDDLKMVPIITGSTARKAIEKLVDEYIKGYPQSSGAGKPLGAIIEAIFNREITKLAVGNWANSIPESQAKDAVNFTNEVLEICRREKLKLRGFTGHSLGGAIAQYLSEQTGPGGLIKNSKKIPAVVFNSPNMGTIQGMRYGEGGGILSINHKLDPLSYLTREVGNKSHSKKDFEIKLDSKYPHPPPAYTTFSKTPFYKWFGAACLYFHSIDTASACLLKGVGERTLKSFFPAVYNDYWDVN